MSSEPSETPEPSVRRARLLVAYDGAGFHGFAENAGVRTVMGEARAAIERVTGVPAQLTGAGRTDAGVHAWGQVVSGDLPDGTDLASLAHRVNRMCGPEIAVRAASWAAPDFDARFSATWRHYRYTVLASPVHAPLLAPTAWHVPQPLDLPVMRLACDPLIGEHDFSSFCRAPKVRPGTPPRSMVRRVLLARWSGLPTEPAVEVAGELSSAATRQGASAVPRQRAVQGAEGAAAGLLRFEIRANAFCHQMVRSIVGTLVDIGLGRIPAGEMRTILRARDRSAAGQVAPPHGLCLWEVGYS